MGIILSGGPDSVTERRNAARTGSRCLSSACRCSVFATACRPWQRNSVARWRRLVREFGYARDARARPFAICCATSRTSQRRRLWPARCVDEPRRQSDAAPPRLQSHRVQRDATPIAGMADEARKFYGLQFHPEVTHTLQGKAILRVSCMIFAALASDWNMPDYVDEVIGEFRSKSAHDEVILGLSGGVDSSVAAALIHHSHRQSTHLRVRR